MQCLWDDKSLYSLQIWPAIAKEIKKKTKAAFLLSQLTCFFLALTQPCAGKAARGALDS